MTPFRFLGRRPNPRACAMISSDANRHEHSRPAGCADAHRRIDRGDRFPACRLPRSRRGSGPSRSTQSSLPPGICCAVTVPGRFIMNTHAVYDSIRLLPPDSVAYGPKTRPLEAHQRWGKATNDPQWAWRIEFGYHQSEEPLPPSICDQSIRRA